MNLWDQIQSKLSFKIGILIILTVILVLLQPIPTVSFRNNLRLRPA